MAIDFSLDIETTTPVNEIAAVVHRHLVTADELDAASRADDLTGEGAVLRNETVVRVGRRTPAPFPSPLSHLEGGPTAYVSFRLDTFGDPVPQEDLVVRTTLTVLDEVDGDAVLRYLSENVWLLRRGGALTLTDDDQFWPPHRLALVTNPYERAPLSMG